MADPTRGSLELPRRVLLEVYEHARECYPEECCGILIGPKGGPPRKAVRCTNLQNRRYAAGESLLDSRHAFWIDPADLLRAVRDLEETGEGMFAVYHSHTDAGAYLSSTDAEGALGPQGSPLWPGVVQLVVSVQGGIVRGASCFDWDDDRREFVGRPVREEP